MRSVAASATRRGGAGRRHFVSRIPNHPGQPPRKGGGFVKGFMELLAESLARKLCDEIEQDIDVDSIAEEVVAELDVAALVSQIRRAIVKRAVKAVIESSGVVKDALDDLARK